MPNIREFDAPQGLDLKPTETGIESFAGAGRRIGGFYNQVSDAYNTVASLKNDEGNRIAGAVKDVGQVVTDYEDHRQISAGAQKGAQLSANLIDQWNSTIKDPNLDPNDPAVAANFRDKVLEPALEKFQDQFTTENSQKWALGQADNLRKHMFEKTAADMSTLAAVATKTNYEKTVNNLSSTVASDPSSLDFALKTVDHSIGAMVDSSPTLDATTAASVKTEAAQHAKEGIVKAAVSGMINKNPNIDLDAVQQKYGDYINGAEMKMFQKAAQTQAKVNLLQNKQLETYTRQQDERKAETAANNTLTKNVKIDPSTGRPAIDPNYFSDALEIAKMPNAPAGLARTLIDWGEHQQNEKAATVIDDPNVKRDLTDRLFDPTNPTTRQDLMKAQVAGKLSDHSFQSMERLVTELEQSPLKGPVWQATAAAAKDALIVNVPGIPGKDTIGTANYSTFMQTFIPQYQAKSRAGTLPPNALDVKDPTSMISQAMAPFKRSPAQRMSDYVAGAGGLGGDTGTKPASRTVGNVPVPAALGGVASLQYNPTTKQWRDQTSGVIYDSAGGKVER